MGRKPRIEFNSGVYHIIQRARTRNEIAVERFHRTLEIF